MRHSLDPEGLQGATGDQQLDKVSLRLLLCASTIETRLKRFSPPTKPYSLTPV
jgi:hypothetical protein